MDAHDDKLTRSAFWCGILKGDSRPVAPGSAVRTIRGAFGAARSAAGQARTDEPLARPRHGGRPPA